MKWIFSLLLILFSLRGYAGELVEEPVFLLLIWCNYPPKLRIQKVSSIEIKADQIYWENIPDLYDSMMESAYADILKNES